MAKIFIDTTDGVPALALQPESQEEIDLLEMFLRLDRQIVSILGIEDTRTPLGRLNA